MLKGPPIVLNKYSFFFYKINKSNADRSKALLMISIFECDICSSDNDNPK